MIDIVLRSGYRDRMSFDYVVNIARYNGDVKIETLLGMLKNGKVPYKKDIITLKGAPRMETHSGSSSTKSINSSKLLVKL